MALSFSAIVHRLTSARHMPIVPVIVTEFQWIEKSRLQPMRGLFAVNAAEK